MRSLNSLVLSQLEFSLRWLRLSEDDRLEILAWLRAQRRPRVWLFLVEPALVIGA